MRGKIRYTGIVAAVFCILPFAQNSSALEGGGNATGSAELLIEQALTATHAPEIYNDLRRSLRDAVMPVLKDEIRGDIPGFPPLDAATATILAKLLTLSDYAVRASDEVEGTVAGNRNAMISEAAGIVSRYASAADIETIRGMFDLVAVKKVLDAVYSWSRLAFTQSYEDARTFAEFSAWVSSANIHIDITALTPGGPGGRVPSSRKVAKVQALVNDALTISRLDSTVDAVKRFIRDVYADTADIPESERQALREKVDQFDFMYNLQKTMVLAAIPSVLAASMTDEQIATIHTFVRTPAMAKVFDGYTGAIVSVTSLTADDVRVAQRAFKNYRETLRSMQLSPQDQQRIQGEWESWYERWSGVVTGAMRPETLAGLKSSFDDVKASMPPELPSGLIPPPVQ